MSFFRFAGDEIVRTLKTVQWTPLFFAFFGGVFAVSAFKTSIPVASGLFIVCSIVLFISSANIMYSPVGRQERRRMEKEL